MAIVSPDRLDEELPFLAALIDLLTDSVRYVKTNRVFVPSPLEAEGDSCASAAG